MKRINTDAVYNKMISRPANKNFLKLTNVKNESCIGLNFASELGRLDTYQAGNFVEYFLKINPI